MKKLLDSKLFFFVLGVLITGVSAVLAYSIFAGDVGFTPQSPNWSVENAEEALNSLYDLYHPPITDELKAFSIFMGEPIGLEDVINEVFLKKVATNPSAVNRLIKTDAFKMHATKANLGYLDISLVKTVNVSKVSYSSQYNTTTWSADKIFIESTSSGWCTLNGQVKNQYVGYDFTIPVYVVAITFMNGYPQTGYVPKSVKLQYSDDNSTWLDASTVYTFPNVTQDSVIVNTLTLDSHRYWRLFVIDSYSSSYVEINALKFYGM